MTTTTSGAVRGGSRRTPARLLVGPVPGILGVVGFLVTWEIVCRLGVVDTRYIPGQLGAARSPRLPRRGGLLVGIGTNVAVTAELVIGGGGLGSLIALAQSGGGVTQLYALILMTGLLGVLINVGMRAVERRTLSWHMSVRGELPS